MWGLWPYEVTCHCEWRDLQTFVLFMSFTTRIHKILPNITKYLPSFFYLWRALLKNPYFKSVNSEIPFVIERQSSHQLSLLGFWKLIRNVFSSNKPPKSSSSYYHLSLNPSWIFFLPFVVNMSSQTLDDCMERFVLSSSRFSRECGPFLYLSASFCILKAFFLPAFDESMCRYSVLWYVFLCTAVGYFLTSQPYIKSIYIYIYIHTCIYVK